MKIFIDSARTEDLMEAKAMGFLDGVTTNPSLVSILKKPYEQIIRDICKICDGPVSAEVLANDFQGMMREALQWAQVAKQIVVKLPLTIDGLKAVRACQEKGIQTNVTLCFSANQALLAAKAGATYVSPFVGRLDDISHDGIELLQEIKTVFDHYEFKTQILAASIRHPLHIKRAAMIGVHVSTLPLKVVRQMFSHPLTDIGLSQFNKDAALIPR